MPSNMDRPNISVGKGDVDDESTVSGLMIHGSEAKPPPSNRSDHTKLTMNDVKWMASVVLTDCSNKESARSAVAQDHKLAQVASVALVDCKKHRNGVAGLLTEESNTGTRPSKSLDQTLNTAPEDPIDISSSLCLKSKDSKQLGDSTLIQMASVVLVDCGGDAPVITSSQNCDSNSKQQTRKKLHDHAVAAKNDNRTPKPPICGSVIESSQKSKVSLASSKLSNQVLADKMDDIKLKRAAFIHLVDCTVRKDSGNSRQEHEEESKSVDGLVELLPPVSLPNRPESEKGSWSQFARKTPAVHLGDAKLREVPFVRLVDFKSSEIEKENTPRLSKKSITEGSSSMSTSRKRKPSSPDDLSSASKGTRV